MGYGGHVTWLIIAAVLLGGCDKKPEPAKATGSGSGSVAGSGAMMGSGAVGSGSAAPLAEAGSGTGASLPASGSGTAASGCDNPTCAMAEMKKFRDDMCKCTDKDCAMGVTTAMTTWAQGMSKSMGNVKPDEAMMKEMEQVGKELGDCTTKAMMAGMDTPPTGDLGLPSPTAGFHKTRTTPIGKKPSSKPACLESGKLESVQCAIDAMGYYTDMMCACPDKTCGEGLVAEMTKWAQEAASSAATTQPSAADMKKMEEIGKRLGECTSDVMLTDPTAK